MTIADSCSSCFNKQPLFNQLTDSELQLISANRTEVIFNSGEIIFKQGTPLTHLACLTKGLAKTYLETPHRRNLIINLLTPVSIIAGPGMWVDFKHHFSVAAVEETVACLIDMNAIKEVFYTNNQFSVELLKMNNVKSISCFTNYLNLSLKHVHGRVADALLKLSAEVYLSNPFTLTLSRQELADMTAMSKETLIRILKEFKDQGLIRMDCDSIKLDNLKELKKISDFG